jgi:hypothetical protein
VQNCTQKTAVSQKVPECTRALFCTLHQHWEGCKIPPNPDQLGFCFLTLVAVWRCVAYISRSTRCTRDCSDKKTLHRQHGPDKTVVTLSPSLAVEHASGLDHFSSEETSSLSLSLSLFVLFVPTEPLALVYFLQKRRSRRDGPEQASHTRPSSRSGRPKELTQDRWVSLWGPAIPLKLLLSSTGSFWYGKVAREHFLQTYGRILKGEVVRFLLAQLALAAAFFLLLLLGDL